MALMEQAKPYGLGTSVDGIFTALQARFGISVVDARARPEELHCEVRTPPSRPRYDDEETSTDRV